MTRDTFSRVLNLPLQKIISDLNLGVACGFVIMGSSARSGPALYPINFNHTRIISNREFHALISSAVTPRWQSQPAYYHLLVENVLPLEPRQVGGPKDPVRLFDPHLSPRSVGRLPLPKLYIQ